MQTPYGEIDLVARDDDTLVFIEVKTRRGDGVVDLWELVRAAQRKRIGRSARYYLARVRPGVRHYRFDLIVVGLSPGGRPAIRWLRNAWSEGDP
ncbi:MAG: YraN family protein [Acidobacteria bacterium]|nr:YraN family protein [Acidobacteriota bacterium]MDW7983797.1 YraN family protein [Acidobacteriota bacterium]